MSQNTQANQGARQDKAALQKSNLETLRKTFGQMERQLAAALPKFITSERMIRVATTTVQRVPKLLECHPVTVVGAVMQSAALGLEPDNITGQAYLVPFWNEKNRRLECNLIPGYRGLMSLARRSKQIVAFDARVVKQGDLFDFEYGSGQFLKHKPALAMANRDGKFAIAYSGNGAEPETIGAYMIAFYNGIGTGENAPPFQFHVMLRPELEKAKQFTKSRTRESEITGPWIEHPDAMFTKTVIRRGSKLLPFSVELDTAVALEERAIAGRSQNLGILAAEALGVDFNASDDEEDGGGGESAEIDPELVKALDDRFSRLGWNEAKRTVKLQEFRGRLPELLQWLDAEISKDAKSAGAGQSENAAGLKKDEPKSADAKPAGSKASTSGRFKI